MRLARLNAALIVAGTAILAPGAAHAQTPATGSAQAYPSKTIRVIATAAGGAQDFVVRLIGQGISGSLGQPMIIENRGGMVGIDAVLNAVPDGYTLLSNGSGLWLAPFMQKVTYDPVRDFTPIAITVHSPNILLVHPSLPVKSVRELVSLAKARPDALNYSSSVTGTSSHLAGELFKSMAGVRIVNIPYKGVGPAITAAIAGHVELTFGSVGSVSAHMKSGKLRALAIASAQASALVPGVPTFAASGLPGFESASTAALFARAKTPAVIVNRLNQEIVKVLSSPAAKERLSNAGLEPASATPEQITAMIKSEMTRMGRVIKDAGIRAE